MFSVSTARAFSASHQEEHTGVVPSRSARLKRGVPDLRSLRNLPPPQLTSDLGGRHLETPTFLLLEDLPRSRRCRCCVEGPRSLLEARPRLSPCSLLLGLFVGMFCKEPPALALLSESRRQPAIFKEIMCVLQCAVDIILFDAHAAPGLASGAPRSCLPPALANASPCSLAHPAHSQMWSEPPPNEPCFLILEPLLT